MPRKHVYLRGEQFRGNSLGHDSYQLTKSKFVNNGIDFRKSGKQATFFHVIQSWLDWGTQSRVPTKLKIRPKK